MLKRRKQNVKRERSQGLRLQRGSGGLGAGKRIGSRLKTLQSASARRDREEKKGGLSVDKHFASFAAGKL